MKLSELVELAEDGYLFFVVDGVKYEIDELIDDTGGEVVLSGYEK